MRVLVTGAFGNVGTSTLEALRGRGHDIRCFDVPSPLNTATAKGVEGCEIFWGDLCDPVAVSKAVEGCDVIVHLAAIIPPLSERSNKLAESVNVGGVEHLIAAAKAQNRRFRFLFASSVSVHGCRKDHSRLIQPGDPVTPSDTYTGTKIKAEALVRDSGLDWSILRLGAVMPLKLGQMDPIMFEIDLDSQVEFVHTRDVGLAFANAVDSKEVNGRTLMIGGGEQCRMLYREFYTKILGALGLGMLPEAAFARKPYYTDWMDTAESNALLRYQKRSFEEYLEELGRIAGWRRFAAQAFRPIAQWWVLRYSPYLKVMS
jgi:nucleoside-diphosphate-sugar epimerase